MLCVGIVCVGHSHARRLLILVKSIVLADPVVRLELRLLTNFETASSIKALFDSWQLPQLTVHYHTVDTAIVAVDLAGLETHHYAGKYAFLKLILPELLPPSVDRILCLDTDLLVLSSLRPLWQQFQHFEDDVLAALVDNLSDWYIPNQLQEHPWPAPKPRGLNTGVMLLRLDRMRARGWRQEWQSTVERVLNTPSLGVTYAALADQDVFNAVFEAHPRY
jgi:glycosyltransferase-like protein LARGE